MKKVFLVCLLIFVMCSATALADEMSEESQERIASVVTETMVVEPRFTYLAHVTIGLGIEGNGYLAYSGSANAPGRLLRVTLYLQRSNNGVIWDELAVTVKTGTGDVMVGEERTIPADDYFYRAKIVAEVLDNNRNVIESVTYYSGTERY